MIKNYILTKHDLEYYKDRINYKEYYIKLILGYKKPTTYFFTYDNNEDYFSTKFRTHSNNDTVMLLQEQVDLLKNELDVDFIYMPPFNLQDYLKRVNNDKI